MSAQRGRVSKSSARGKYAYIVIGLPKNLSSRGDFLPCSGQRQSSERCILYALLERTASELTVPFWCWGDKPATQRNGTSDATSVWHLFLEWSHPRRDFAGHQAYAKLPPFFSHVEECSLPPPKKIRDDNTWNAPTSC